MSQFMNSGAAAGTLNAWLMIADEDNSDQFEPRFNWCYQGRNSKSAGGTPMWIDLWPSPRLGSGDSTVALALFGQDWSDAGKFEYPSTISRGMVRPFFFRGTCKNSVGNPLGGAVVQGFLTATDAYVGEVACASNGTYELPTIYSGAAHYLVAYYPGSPDIAGTTLNTLTPSL